MKVKWKIEIDDYTQGEQGWDYPKHSDDWDYKFIGTLEEAIKAAEEMVNWDGYEVALICADVHDECEIIATVSTIPEYFEKRGKDFSTGWDWKSTFNQIRREYESIQAFLEASVHEYNDYFELFEDENNNGEDAETYIEIEYKDTYMYYTVCKGDFEDYNEEMQRKLFKAVQEEVRKDTAFDDKRIGTEMNTPFPFDFAELEYDESSDDED